MMGRMYRPLRISKRNRGYQFLHKYMSNLLGRENGGVQNFEQTVELKAIDSNGAIEESIRIEFNDLTIPVLVDGNQYESNSTKQVTEKKRPFEIIDEKKAGVLSRKMERPGISIDLASKSDNPFSDFKEAEQDEGKEKWLLRTDMSSRGEELFFEMPIYPNRIGEGTDWLKIEIKPVVMNGEEYLEVKTDSLTQVVIVSNSKIEFRP